MIERFDLVYRNHGDSAEMIRRWPSDERSPGEWCRWEDHVEETCRMRDFLLARAKECEACGGTGCVTVIDTVTDADLSARALRERVEPCGDCEPIREALGDA